MTDPSIERETRLQRYIDRRLSDQESAEFEHEVLASDELSEELVDELSLRELIEARRRGTRNVRRVRSMGPRRWLYSAVAVAAAVSLFMFWPGDDSTAPPVFRGDDAQAIVALEPLGSLSQAPGQFRWRSIQGAQSYRLEVFDGEARRVLIEAVADTSFHVPEIQPMPSSGFWQITPLDDLGMPGSRSEPFRFVVAP